MFDQRIIEKLQAVRRQTFSNYDLISLDRGALETLAHLFINPECQTDIDFLSLPGEKIQLSTLGDHIITAAPTTLAKYANAYQLENLSKENLLSCFAFEHADDVKINKIHTEKNPLYALAHILNFSYVSKVLDYGNKKLAELYYPTAWGKIIFKNVLLPKTIKANVGSGVYHHFGVVVGLADNEAMKDKIIKVQKQKEFTGQLLRLAAKEKIVIDFSKPSIFKKDITGLIIKPKNVKPIKTPQDIKFGKTKFQN